MAWPEHVGLLLSLWLGSETVSARWIRGEGAPAIGLLGDRESSPSGWRGPAPARTRRAAGSVREPRPCPAGARTRGAAIARGRRPASKWSATSAEVYFSAAPEDLALPAISPVLSGECIIVETRSAAVMEPQGAPTCHSTDRQGRSGSSVPARGVRHWRSSPRGRGIRSLLWGRDAAQIEAMAALARECRATCPACRCRTRCCRPRRSRGLADAQALLLAVPAQRLREVCRGCRRVRRPW